MCNYYTTPQYTKLRMVVVPREVLPLQPSTRKTHDKQIYVAAPHDNCVLSNTTVGFVNKTKDSNIVDPTKSFASKPVKVNDRLQSAVLKPLRFTI